MKKVSKSEMMSMIFICMIEIYYMINFSYWQHGILSTYKYLVYASIPFFVIYLVVRNKYTIREVIWISIIISISLLISLNTKEFTVFLSFLCIIAAMDIDKKILLRNIFITKLTCFIITIFSSLIGIIPNESYEYTRFFSFFNISQGNIMRYCLGFIHANTVGIIAFELIVLYVFIYYKNRKFNFNGFIIILLFQFIVYFLCRSRSSLISTILFLLIILIKDNIKINKSLIGNTSIFIMIFGSYISSYGLMQLIKLNSYLFNVANLMLQGRLIYINAYLNKFGIRLFGNDISDLTDLWGVGTGESIATLDAGYASLLIRYGLVLTITLIFLYYKLLKKTETCHRFLDCLILILSLYSFSENVFVFITKNISLFYFSELFSRKGILNANEKNQNSNS